MLRNFKNLMTSSLIRKYDVIIVIFEVVTTQESLTAQKLYSSKAIAGKKLSLSSWCIASLYIYHS